MISVKSNDASRQSNKTPQQPGCLPVRPTATSARSEPRFAIFVAPRPRVSTRYDEDFVDLRTHVDRRFTQVDRGFEQVDRGFAEMRGRLDATAAGQQRIAELIESLIDRNNP